MLLQEWLDQDAPIIGRMSGEDVYWSSLLACCEMLHAGITTFADMFFFEGFDVGATDPFPAFDERIGNLRYLPKSAEEIEPSSAPTRMSMLQAKQRLVELLGRALTMEEGDALRARYDGWMTAAEVEDEAEKLRARAARAEES